MSSWGSTVLASGSGVEASSSSRWDGTETYSPAPIDRAPASRPAVRSAQIRLSTPLALTAATSERLLTRPSSAPKTAARNVPESRLRPRAARPRTTSRGCAHRPPWWPWRRDRPRTGPRLGPLGQRQHENRPNRRARGPTAGSGSRRAAVCRPGRRARRTSAFAPALRVGQRQQDLPFLTAAVSGQVAIDGGLHEFIRQVLAPAPQLLWTGRRIRRGTARLRCGHRQVCRAGGVAVMSAVPGRSRTSPGELPCTSFTPAGRWPSSSRPAC